MKFTVVLTLLMILLPLSGAGALEMYVAPVLYVDETGGNSSDAGNIQTDLLAAFHSAETYSALQFVRLKDKTINPPSSLFDAITICRNEQIEYLLYGYVTKREYTIQAELRLFDYSSRTVRQLFFGMDSPDRYDRLIHDITGKILQYLNETYKLNIRSETAGETRLFIPATAGYWTPMDNAWVRKLAGTVSAGSGITFIPNDFLWLVWGVPCYLSMGLEAKYRLGIGNPSGYEAYNHCLYLTMPLRLHISFLKQHEAFLGLGYTHFLEFFSITGKYTGRESHTYSNMGMYAGFGYRFAMSDSLYLFFRNDFDFLFNRRSLITYSPALGLEIQIYKKEILKKW